MADLKTIDRATQDLQRLEKLYHQKKIRKDTYDRERKTIVRWINTNVIKGKT